MKKQTLSIHKSFLNLQTTLTNIQKNKKTVKVVKPGNFFSTVTKPVLKQKTDRGNQLITLSNYKKCLKSVIIKNNRLDLILFYLKFSKSLSESKHLISQRFIKVNGLVVTNVDYILEEYSIIECNGYNFLPFNFITHEISNTIVLPTNIIRITENKGVYYNTPETKGILLPININIPLMQRMQ